MELPQCNCSSLRSATRALSLAFDDALRPSGLRVTQFAILSGLAVIGELPLSELADLMVMDRTTLGRNLKPLQRDELVEINVGADRRERLVSITPTGLKTFKRAMPLWEEIQRRFEKKVGKREAKELRDKMVSLVNVGRELAAEN
jgi:DNA-binding MarR family transcriptional regulator